MSLPGLPEEVVPCGWPPPPETGACHPCPACGHAAAMHVGVNACPLCILQMLLSEQAVAGMRLAAVLQQAVPHGGMPEYMGQGLPWPEPGP
jgi:hypothetical protein